MISMTALEAQVNSRGHRNKCWLTYLCRKDLDGSPHLNRLSGRAVHRLSGGEPSSHLFQSVCTEWHSPAQEHLWAALFYCGGGGQGPVVGAGTHSIWGRGFTLNRGLCCQPLSCSWLERVRGSILNHFLPKSSLPL